LKQFCCPYFSLKHALKNWTFKRFGHWYLLKELVPFWWTERKILFLKEGQIFFSAHNILPSLAGFSLEELATLHLSTTGYMPTQCSVLYFRFNFFFNTEHYYLGWEISWDVSCSPYC
jgi:hypothetical protein